MEGIFVRLLSPIFIAMGVSEADLVNYVNGCAPFIYVILAALVVMIVLLIAARAAKKGTRHVVRWASVLGCLAVVLVCANAMCFGPLKPALSVVMNAAGDVSESSAQASREVVTQIAEEGIVLVKNDDNLLPLSDTGNINVFGWASTDPIYGGTGSGSGDASKNVTLLQGLNDAGFVTNTELTDMYLSYYDAAAARAAAGGGGLQIGAADITLYQPTVDYYTDDVMKQAQEFSDTAVIVISRGGGEGYDLPTDMNAVIHGTYDVAQTNSVVPENYAYTGFTYTNQGTVDDFDPGESYLELSHPEKDMIEKVCASFENVVVIINANNTMELDWVDNYPSIKSVLLCPGPGASGFTALGEIMSGAVNPSGRTADTFVKDLQYTPWFNNFGNFAYNNVDDLKQAIAAADPAYEGNMAFVNYVEGIYVGYKFYETAAVENAIDYDSMVQYPFGYGLSYTEFSQEISNFNKGDDSVTFDVTVTNTGSVAGKDVVEVYFTPPYTNGGIEKSAVNLVEFGKTQLLEPGASETISFDIALEDMASYDSAGIKVNGGGYVLEAGEYEISIRSDSHTVIDSETFSVASDVMDRASDQVTATNVLADYCEGDVKYLSRADHFANYDEVTAAPAEAAYAMSDETRAQIEPFTTPYYDSTLYDDPAAEMPTLGADNGLKLADMYGLPYDDPQWDLLLDQMTFEEMTMLVNMGGWQTVAVESVGKVATADSDGPAGLNNFITGKAGTQFAVETMVAQTWSKDLAAAMGEAMGQEFVDVSQFGDYGPAMNTHRTAFAGRNFEYFSEDGVLGGYLAAAECNALGAKGVYPYIKHFALNDQEWNRCTFLLTFSTEQAAREIYLKPFEIATKSYEYPQFAVMSSFNFIGTKASCANSDLLNTILRDEWGFQGLVITDYDGSYGYMITDNCVRNGNDLMLGFSGSSTNVISNNSASITQALRESCKNIMYTIGNSGYYANGDPTAGMDKMTKTFVAIDAVGGILILGALAAVVARWRRKAKDALAGAHAA